MVEEVHKKPPRKLVTKWFHLCQRRKSDRPARSGTRKTKTNISFITTILTRQTLPQPHPATTKLTPIMSFSRT